MYLLLLTAVLRWRPLLVHSSVPLELLSPEEAGGVVSGASASVLPSTSVRASLIVSSLVFMPTMFKNSSTSSAMEANSSTTVIMERIRIPRLLLLRLRSLGTGGVGIGGAGSRIGRTGSCTVRTGSGSASSAADGLVRTIPESISAAAGFLSLTAVGTHPVFRGYFLSAEIAKHSIYLISELAGRRRSILCFSDC